MLDRMLRREGDGTLRTVRAVLDERPAPRRPPEPPPPMHEQQGSFWGGFLAGVMGNLLALRMADMAYRAGTMGSETRKGIFVGSMVSLVALTVAILAYVWTR